MAVKRSRTPGDREWIAAWLDAYNRRRACHQREPGVGGGHLCGHLELHAGPHTWEAPTTSQHAQPPEQPPPHDPARA